MITRVGQSAPALHLVSTYGVYSPLGPGILFQPLSIGLAARTDYYALDIPATHVIRRFWWANGATVSGSRTLIAALYADTGGFKPGVRLGTTAATAQGTANQLQFAAPSGGDFSISPGLYWMSLACDSVSGAPTGFGANMLTATNLVGAYQEATTTPPATATPVEKTSAVYYLCGFSTTTLT
jgi:hypothetical protein